MNLAAILGLLLAISLAGNAMLAKAWTSADRRATQVAEQRDQARASATACSDATESLRELAATRAAEAKKATAAANERARTAEERANRERSAPVTAPEAPAAEACDLAQRQNAEWLINRKKP